MCGKVRIKNLFILGVALVVMGTSIPGSRAAYLSPKEETELGERFLASISSQYEFADYPYIIQYMNELGTYIGSHIEVPYFPLKFYVIKDSTVNAFAAPAGHVFFFSGLIGILDDADELASILAHELGHVSARHLVSRVDRSQKIGLATLAGMLAGILVGGEVGGALMTGSVAASIQAELGYSREDERQADQLGFKYTQLSGFDPAGMLTALQKIQRENWYGSQDIPAYLLTHPGAPERMATIESMLRGYEKTSDHETTKKLRALFPIFQTMVIALCLDKEQAARELEKRLRDDPSSGTAHYGLGLILQREGKLNQALEHFKIAGRENTDSIPVMFSLAETYQMLGEYEDSVSVLRKALELSPKDKEILFLLALSLQELEQYSQASEIYERLTFLPPVKDTVYYNLGIVYGRQGKLALAHYNLGIYFSKLRSREKASFHFEKAKELVSNDAALQNKIEKALVDIKESQSPH
jgi:predicted Zn-dependent protease